MSLWNAVVLPHPTSQARHPSPGYRERGRSVECHNSKAHYAQPQNPLALYGHKLWDRSPDRELGSVGPGSIQQWTFLWLMPLFPDWSRVPQI